ncbi:thioredoxin family protein [Methanococcoides orientis]|uniref:thioredoxin family protein n=1 Tax=Methanococcoides orientis TaxID=2822137 RepID=UPI001E30CC78|nr:thioredoxin family protein [Methanococcoides orientis]UGV41681.1 thioredoxin family protein [Methanococcoides orientis]
MGLGDFISNLFGKEKATVSSEPIVEEISTNLYEINTRAFDNEVVNSHLPVIVDCFTKTCPPCRKMAPIFEKVAAEYDGKIKFVKINLKNSPGIAKQFKIVGVPTFLFFRSGEMVTNVVGFVEEEKLKEKLETLLE